MAVADGNGPYTMFYEKSFNQPSRVGYFNLALAVLPDSPPARVEHTLRIATERV